MKISCTKGFVSLLALLFLTPAWAYARDYVVSPKGSGSACSNAAPCSVSAGINAAKSGDHVVFDNGTYGPVASKRSGVTFRAKNTRKATINGNGKNGMNMKHSDITIRGLVVTTGKKGSSSGIVFDTDVSNILIEDNHIKDVGHAGIKIGPRTLGNALKMLPFEII